MEQCDRENRILHNKRESAALLNLSERMIEYLIARHELRSVKIGKRRLIARTELERFARQRAA
jgi:excisionase family DNA binding protein